LVSKLVDEDSQGEALGALNGIKALTEGFGPLVFGFLMVSVSLPKGNFYVTLKRLTTTWCFVLLPTIGAF
jgi:hypothetical protein